MKRSLLLLFIVAATAAALPVSAQELTPPVVDIAVRPFVFDPSHITLRRGESVTLRFSAEERGLRVSQRDLRIDLALTPEHTSEVTVTPPKTGRFVVVCRGRETMQLIIDVTG